MAPTYSGRAIEDALAPHGLLVLGKFNPRPDDGVPNIDGQPARGLIMVGNAGGSLWPAFSASPEYLDGHPHPLDRWTKRVLTSIAQETGVPILFPFDGPPYFPFPRWLSRASAVSQSPLGLFVHAEFGPWVALRGAFLLREPVDRELTGEGPCPTCTDKPCLDACPALAITRTVTYQPDICRTHLHTQDGQTCIEGGCLVRHACPVGQDHVTPRQQAALHMRAFRG